MTRAEANVDQVEYFEAMYRASDDPYALGSRWYEARKRAVLLASLPRRMYRSAYEPGCGAGELTLALAERCEALLSSDRSARAVELVQRKAQAIANVQVEQHALPDDWPTGEGRFDLVVLSEIGYFFEPAAWTTLAQRCEASLAPDATLVACDWRPDFKERVQSTDDVHGALSALGLTRALRHEEDDFLLQVWTRQRPSVAQAEGIR